MKVTLPVRTVNKWREGALLAQHFRNNGRDEVVMALEEALSQKVRSGLARAYGQAVHHRVLVENALVHSMVHHMEKGGKLPPVHVHQYKAAAFVHADGDHFWVQSGAHILMTNRHRSEIARAR